MMIIGMVWWRIRDRKSIVERRGKTYLVRVEPEHENDVHFTISAIEREFA